MPKKVCCITPINTPNYGTVLQAFALQEAVKSLGCEYSVLNYYSREQELKFSFWGSTRYMNWKYRVAKKVLYPLRHYQLRRILSFQNEYTNLSERYMTREALEKCESRYDAFITGSDQVWNNQEINHFDDAYFLAFAGKKTKLSYAASFGKTYQMLEEKDKVFYQKQIKYIDKISVREKSGQEIVKRIANRESQWVCDPVYLLSRTQWEHYSKTPKHKGYILAYLVGDGINFDVNRKIVSLAKKLAKEQKVKLVVIGIGLSSVLYGGIKTPTVPEWIGLIKNADLLLTNAFHGTAFATIFGTPFYTFVRGDSNNRMNTRIFDLLDYLGLDDRIVGFNTILNLQSIENAKIETAWEKIENLKKDSYDFLKEAIGLITE